MPWRWPSRTCGELPPPHAPRQRVGTHGPPPVKVEAPGEVPTISFAPRVMTGPLALSATYSLSAEPQSSKPSNEKGALVRCQLGFSFSGEFLKQAGTFVISAACLRHSSA